MKSWQKVMLPALCIGVMTSGVASRAEAQTASIKIDGSSTVFPISEALAEEFQISKRGKVRVTVGIAGTGGGFKKFCRGETDISNASRPISREEMDACKAAGIQYIEIPIAFDALTVVVNKENTWAKTMTIADLKKIWSPDAQGRVNNWNQVKSGYPNLKMMLFGPGTDSGTFDYFTEAVNGKSKASRSDYSASEDDNTLVQGVENNKGGLGYFGFAYYSAHKDKLTAVAIDGGKGPVEPTIANVLNGTYQPLSRPLFIYVKLDAASRPEVQEFVRFSLTKGAGLVQEVGYIPLPASAYPLVLKHFEQRKTGSVFGGVPKVGVTIEQLLEMEAKL